MHNKVIGKLSRNYLQTDGMESKSFKELSNNFTSKLDGIGRLLNLRDAAEDETCVEQLESLQLELKTRENKLFVVKRELAARQESLNKIRSWNEILKQCQETLTYMADNMPALPKRPITSNEARHSQSSGKLDTGEQDTSRCKSNSGRQVVGKQEVGIQKVGKQEIANTYCPELEWLTTDEFDKIPKYLKGRLSYDQLNKFIEGMNKAYNAKYKLLKLKKSSLNDAKRKKYETFKLQETKDTKGSYFVVDEDLKEFGGLKVDKVARSILTILRHCGRCREVRGGCLTRYCYIDSY